ncbi:hypothetical protein PR048_020322 [Dryococelus australis]|uniref:HAT C-terminal dimerisation domain-containing protein n=1 Tax=Dryococelus australis TaxID=614101 RepID=A0ABQ9H600_9NEOP|nr:hypothetical protein PR048_020322 [Dryococelus australis]
MQSLRHSWEIILQESKVLAEAVGISSHFVTRRRSSRLPNADENTIEEKLQLEAINEFKCCVIFPVLDSFMADLKTRFASYELICHLGSPILTMDLDSDQLKIKTKLLVSKYPKDLAHADDLNEEILHMKSVRGTEFHSENDPLRLLNSIYEKKLEAIFVNLCTGIKLFFCMIPVTVSIAERMANSLKIWQRSITSQNRRKHLAILGTENVLAKNVDFSDIIDHFSQKKSQEGV